MALCSLDVKEPEKPADFDTNPRARANYLVNMKAILNDKRGNHGERCHVNYKLEIARAVSPLPLPNTLDYFTDMRIQPSSSTTNFTYPTTSTSEAAPIPSHRT